jgi:membrane protein
LRDILKSYYLFIRGLFYEIFQNKVSYYASSLSWDTLFAFIPFSVVLFSVFTILPIFDSVKDNIKEIIFSSLIPSNSKYILEHFDYFLHNSDQLGAFGLVYMLFAVTLFFKTYDYAMNDIFDMPNRGFWSAVKLYFLFMIIMPIVIGASFFFSVYLDKVSFLHEIASYLLPFLFAWFAFFVAYLLTPNRDIETKAALISSLIASSVWYLSKSAFVFYVSHSDTYSTIYGSISTVLYFFLWIYLSWAIFLHGARFCHVLDKHEDINTIS